MDTEQRIYPNGLKLVVNNNQNHLACVAVRISAGSANEKKKFEGISTILEKSFLCGTNQNPSPKSIRSHIESFGGVFTSRSALDAVELSIACECEHILDAIDCCAEIVFDTQLKQTDIERTKQFMTAMRKSYESDPNFLCYDELRALVFDGTGLGFNIMGRAATIDKIVVNDVREFRENALCGSNITISVTGNADIDTVYEKAFDCFYSRLLERNGKKIKDVAAIEDNEKRKHATCVVKRLNQSRVGIGYLTKGSTSRDFLPLSLGLKMMELSVGARLRSIDGIYGPKFQIRSFANNGMLSIIFACDKDKIDDVLPHVGSVLSDLVKDGFSNDDFDAAKAVFRTEYLSQLQTSQEFSRHSAKYFDQTDVAFVVEDELDSIEKITQGDCLRALRRLVATRAYLVIVGESVDAQVLLQKFEKKTLK